VRLCQILQRLLSILLDLIRKTYRYFKDQKNMCDSANMLIPTWHMLDIKQDRKDLHMQFGQMSVAVYLP
jgi:hypothetical protein